jgi:hypothetical protein
MQSATQTVSTPVSKGALWTGRILSGFAVLFLLFDSTMKLMKAAPVLETMPKLGWSAGLAAPLGAILLVCLIFYVIPKTSVLGAILLTGYLGGAVATHTRIGDPFFSHILFPTYLGLFLWGGLYLREPRLRQLIPLRS